MQNGGKFMRENMDVTLEQLISQWERCSGIAVTEELLQSPDFIKTLIIQEWYNIINGRYKK